MAHVRLAWSHGSSAGAPQLTANSDDGEEHIDLGKLRLEAEWLGWEQADVAVERIRQDLPSLLEFHRYSFAGSLRKRLWGACYRHSALASLAADQLRTDGHIVEFDVPWRVGGDQPPLGSGADESKVELPWATATRIWWGLARSGSTDFSSSQNDAIAFLAGSPRRLSYYESLLTDLAPLPRIACFGVDESTEDFESQQVPLKRMGVEGQIVEASVPRRELPREAVAIARIVRSTKRLSALIGAEEARVAIRFVLGRRTFAWKVESLFREAKPSVLLVNAYEVAPPADLLMQMAAPHEVAVINSMNGTKVASPGHGGVVFDAWLVHSETQRQVLVEECAVEPDQLHVVGHPRADSLAEHVNTHSARALIADWDGLTVVAAFSQPAVLPGDYRHKFFAALRALVDQRTDLAVTVKLHPRESLSDLPPSFAETDRLKIVPADVDLYDLLADCDAVAVMYSTVAMEALQMGKAVVALNQTGVAGLLPGAGISDWFRETTTSADFIEAFTRLPDGRTNREDIESIVGPVDGQVTARMAELIAAQAGLEHE